MLYNDIRLFKELLPHIFFKGLLILLTKIFEKYFECAILTNFTEVLWLLESHK